MIGLDNTKISQPLPLKCPAGLFDERFSWRYKSDTFAIFEVVLSDLGGDQSLAAPGRDLEHYPALTAGNMIEDRIDGGLLIGPEG